MALDPDAAAMIALLNSGVPLPGPGSDAAAYRKASAAARPPVGEPIAVPIVESFPIPSPGGGLDVRFYGSGRARTPLLIFLHGGGWVNCDLDSHDDLCRRICRESGWSVLAVDYRLAPEHPFPAALDDSYTALDWAQTSATDRFDIDTDKIVVGGDSAGGNLAAAVALLARDRGGPRIAHQLLLYPVLDVDFDTPSYRDNGTDYFLTTRSMRWYWEQYAGSAGADIDPLAAPCRMQDLTDLPPATIITAGYDPLRDEGRRYADRLRDASVRVDYHCYEGTFHAFASMPMLLSAQRLMKHIAQILQQVEDGATLPS
jgi:acetyl esterase